MLFRGCYGLKNYLYFIPTFANVSFVRICVVIVTCSMVGFDCIMKLLKFR